MIKAFLKKVGLLSKSENRASPPPPPLQPRIIPREAHHLSRRDISANALKVLYRLHNHGYEAFLVGGGVRDLLLGLHPKDFDVVTNATPEEVAKVFRNCRIIGRRFRLAHVFFGPDIVEVATFRGVNGHIAGETTHSEQGLILRDNQYGTLQEDVWRRDFTINALYYNIADYTIVDFVGGYEDIQAKRLRMIGDVGQRYREDPVRILRAIRFASKLELSLDNELTQPLTELKTLIGHVSSARLFEEVLKLFHSGHGLRAYQLLVAHGLITELFPETSALLKSESYPTDKLLSIVFENTDLRIRENKHITPSFVISALLWHPICEKAFQFVQEGMHPYTAKMTAIESILSIQLKRISIPRKIVQGAREIWQLQMRLLKRSAKSIFQVFSEPRFRAAYDFLELRAKAGEDVVDCVHWWQTFISADEEERRMIVKKLSRGPKRKKRRKKE